jgi:H+/Cl- antiporter ClcA
LVSIRAAVPLLVTTIGLAGSRHPFMPGHGGPGPAEGHGIGETGIPMRTVPGLVLAALLSLAVGASLGPEAPLLGIAAAIGPWVATRIGRETLGKLFTMAGVGSIFSLLFGSPLAATFVGLEMTPTPATTSVFMRRAVARRPGSSASRHHQSSLDSLATPGFPRTRTWIRHLLAASSPAARRQDCS